MLLHDSNKVAVCEPVNGDSHDVPALILQPDKLYVVVLIKGAESDKRMKQVMVESEALKMSRINHHGGEKLLEWHELPQLYASGVHPNSAGGL